MCIFKIVKKFYICLYLLTLKDRAPIRTLSDWGGGALRAKMTKMTDFGQVLVL